MVTISCGYAINIEAFRQYCHDTARLYSSLYNWYWMSSAVHKLLIHGADFVNVSPLPIGFMSEEALESRHKDLRYFRKHHTRLCNRVAGNSDLLHNLLVSSDPLMYYQKPKPKSKFLKLCSSVLALLRDPPSSAIEVPEDFGLDDDDEVPE